MSLTSCLHCMYHLQVVFMMCVAFRLAAFLALDAFRLVFITCFPHFLFSSRVSLLGFLSLCSAYVFQAGFMVFSAPNLVFVACVAFSLVFGIFCSYLFSISILPFGTFFSWCVASFVLVCGASFWSSISHFLYFAVRVFLRVLLAISCSL